MEDSFQQARLLLPNFPNEVICHWIDKCIRKSGWPPAGIEWDGFLLGRPLSFWQKIEWKKTEVNLSWPLLGPRSQFTTKYIIDAHVYNKPNLVSAYVQDSRTRFLYIMKYALDNGTIPGPLVLVEENNHYEVAEGNHRVAVLIALQNSKSTQTKIYLPQQAWVGKTRGCAGDE